MEKLDHLVLVLAAAQDRDPLAEVKQTLRHLQETAAKQCSNASLLFGRSQTYAEEVMRVVNSITTPSRGPQVFKDINMIPDCCIRITEKCDQTMEGMEQLRQEIPSAVHRILNALKDGTFSS
jgi:hypothetical protein